MAVAERAGGVGGAGGEGGAGEDRSCGGKREGERTEGDAGG